MPAARRLIIAGLATFLAGLVILFPARVAINAVEVPGVSIAGVSGSVWNGVAQDVNVNGVYIRDVSWQLRPLALLIGRVDADVEANLAGGFVETRLSLGGGSLEVTDLRGSVALGSLSALVGIPGLAGVANATFERIEVSDGVPVAADGSVEVADLLLPLVSRSPIGGFRAELFTRDDGGIAGSVEDTDGLIDLAGSLELSASRAYTFIGQVAPKEGTPNNIRQQMRFLGSPNERGQYELRLEGQL